MFNLFSDRKLQIYSAITIEEYDRAIAWIRERLDESQIKEAGYLQISDWMGRPLNSYTFIYSASNDVAYELSNYMSTPILLT